MPRSPLEIPLNGALLFPQQISEFKEKPFQESRPRPRKCTSSLSSHKLPDARGQHFCSVVTVTIFPHFLGVQMCPYLMHIQQQLDTMGFGYSSPYDTNPFLPGTQLGYGAPNMIPHYSSPFDTNPYVAGTQIGGMGYGGMGGMGYGGMGGMGYGGGYGMGYGSYGGYGYY